MKLLKLIELLQQEADKAGKKAKNLEVSFTLHENLLIHKGDYHGVNEIDLTKK